MSALLLLLLLVLSPLQLLLFCGRKVVKLDVFEYESSCTPYDDVIVCCIRRCVIDTCGGTVCDGVEDDVTKTAAVETFDDGASDRDIVEEGGERGQQYDRRGVDVDGDLDDSGGVNDPTKPEVEDEGIGNFLAAGW